MTTTGHRNAEASGFSFADGVAAIFAALRRLALSIVAPTLSLAVICVAWIGFLHLFSVDRMVARTPLDVWSYLVLAHSAAHNRQVLFADFAVTLGHAGIGFAAGLCLGSAVAILFVMSSSVERALLPLAMILRSVPLVAMMPLIVLVFGRGLASIAVIGTAVVFFPTMVNVALGLRSAPRLAGDLVRVYGGNATTMLRKVQIPSALPALFASARIAVPGSLVGALLAEWLATGDGLGSRMQRDVFAFKSTDLWSAVALLTAMSLVGYFAVGVVERAALTWQTPDCARE